MLLGPLMTNKTIMVGLVALAFVTGSVLTGAIAFADDDDDDDNKGKKFKKIWKAIANLQTQIDDISELETRITALENQEFDIVETQRISTSQVIPPGQRELVQTSPCNADEFIHGFGFSQNIGGTSLGADAQPIDTIFMTPRPDGGKLAVRVANTLDDGFNLNLDVFCGKIMPVP